MKKKMIKPSFLTSSYIRIDKEDDGGTSKSSTRLYKRKIHRWKWNIYIIISLTWFGYKIWQSRSSFTTNANGRTTGRAKNKFLKKNFLRNSYGNKNKSFHIIIHNDNNTGLVKHEYNYSPYRRYRWVNHRHLPPIPDVDTNGNIESSDFYTDDGEWVKKYLPKVPLTPEQRAKQYVAFKLKHKNEFMDWEKKFRLPNNKTFKGPKINYANVQDVRYKYPTLVPYPPSNGSYPLLLKLGNIFNNWPQDDVDFPPSPIREHLQHFNYQNRKERQMAIRYRDLELPFKVTNVPEIIDAGKKWTDPYLIWEFDRKRVKGLNKDHIVQSANRGSGHAQESVDNFFCFYRPNTWFASTMGLPPTFDNDFTFQRWSNHANYADDTNLSANETHYYWQSGVSQIDSHNNYEEDEKKSRVFINRDLPSFSGIEPNFFVFDPSKQKGIQCRFGERGVVAATHYDAGRNMIAMITGAKRYILQPPNSCGKLGLIAAKRHSAFRHSLLNFAHMSMLDIMDYDEDVYSMPMKERKWLEIARDSLAVETVLKAGEVLYIPSHWFHYIISLQKSAQCNARSGRDMKGNVNFGGQQTVERCV